MIPLAVLAPIPPVTAAHAIGEVSQPLAAIATGAEAALRWLARDPPDLDEARAALAIVIGGSRRAADVLAGARDLVARPPPSAIGRAPDRQGIGTPAQHITAL